MNPAKKYYSLLFLLSIFVFQPSFSNTLPAYGDGEIQAEIFLDKLMSDQGRDNNGLETKESSYNHLKEAGVIGENENLNTTFYRAFNSLHQSEKSMQMLLSMSKAFSSEAYDRQKHLPSAETDLANMARAISFGEPVHESVATSVNDDLVKGFILESFGYYIAPYLLEKLPGKMQISIMLNAAHSCRADAIVYNGWWPLQSYEQNQQTIMLSQFMQSCKMSEQVLQQAVEQKQPLTPGLINYAKAHGFQLSLEEDGRFFSNTIQGLEFVIDRAKKLDGAMFLAVFKGNYKYQFGTFGVYQNRLNFSYVADDNEPTPILTFSMDLDDVKGDLLTKGIEALMNGVPGSERDLMDKVDSIWLMQQRPLERDHPYLLGVPEQL